MNKEKILGSCFPDLAAEWHPTNNEDLTPEQVNACSSKKVWWLGKCGHEWEASIVNRSKGRGCPICAGKVVLLGFNDLATIRPDLAAEWHPTKNGDLTPETVSAGSHKKIWWICNKGHEWQAMVFSRISGCGCPVCCNRGRPRKKKG